MHGREGGRNGSIGGALREGRTSMCDNGVNTGQLRSSIQQIDESVALSRRWTHRAYHLADGGSMPKTAAKLEEAQKLLDEARSMLAEAMDTVEDEDAGFTVEAV